MIFFNQHKKKQQQNNIIFEITQKCNHNCIYCYNVWKNKKEYPKGELDTETTIKLLNKIIEQTSCKTLIISGGEPCIREDIFEIIEKIRKKVSSLVLITNGSLLTKDSIKKLINLGVDLFEITLLSYKPETVKELTGTNNYDKILDSIISVKELKGKICTVFVATKINLQDLENTLKLSISIGVDGFVFNRINIGGNAIEHIKKLMPDAESLKSALKTLNEYSEKYNFPVSLGIPVMPCIFDLKKYPKLNYGFCLGGLGEQCYYTFDPLGNVRICNHSDYICGNIFRQNFEKIIETKYIKEFRKNFPVYCQNCNDADICQAGCRAAAEVCFGSLKEEEPFLRTVDEINRKKTIKNIIK